MRSRLSERGDRLDILHTPHLFRVRFLCEALLPGKQAANFR